MKVSGESFLHKGIVFLLMLSLAWRKLPRCNVFKMECRLQDFVFWSF
ncbi:hypothetical protein ECTW00353_2937 [Escherichia coli TW00353]|nr:hypothetical protein ECDEC6C_3226 [Escherichia coli DEC6C]EKI26330.1 hypothetical protein ECTW00353_2937 [Escherichia coli TW00353]